MTIKKIIKKIIPPIFADIIRYLRTNKNDGITWNGDYKSWQEANRHCKGYDADNILFQCKNALLKVKNKEAVYERDGVVFDTIAYSWAVLAMLQRIAKDNNNELCVLDFGGSLGSTYYQNKDFLSPLNTIKWCIVEQPHFVACGKQHFQNDELQFYYSIEDCLAENKPNVLLLSSVLQYLEYPNEWINTLIALNLPYIIIDRTAFVDYHRAILTVETVPPSMYQASYPSWFFNFEQFIEPFLKSYSIISIFDSFADNSMLINDNKKADWKGILLKKIN
jgi:putative methyltransferase (TIGR04325 family)